MTKNIKAFIVEDEERSSNLLLFYLQKHCPQIEIIGNAFTYDDAVLQLNSLKPELIFMDIILDKGTGFDVLEMVELTNTKIIFITALSEYAIKAFKYNAIDYILKPYDPKEIVLAVQKAVIELERESFTNSRQIETVNSSMNTTEKNFDFIAVPSMNEIDFVKLIDIVYLKSDGRYTVFHLSNDTEIVSSKNIGMYEDILDSNLFFRIHNSYIINLSKVKKINKSGGNYCEMSNGKSLPIAKRRQEVLYKIIYLK
ncbi:LytR/AlgR family response regulator transcription factor [Lacinutrix jangbogonensis]|uniref:LytR/AlgR family response regulator transcription factor n=1 Tax=Lacinutrix jangbogonensis TaxID=1469557 RepID=UPI00053D640A|nr:LytTR family DNA-binding domain-containing protein [Lacinutrix jangbogonensis]